MGPDVKKTEEQLKKEKQAQRESGGDTYPERRSTSKTEVEDRIEDARTKHPGKSS